MALGGSSRLTSWFVFKSSANAVIGVEAEVMMSADKLLEVNKSIGVWFAPMLISSWIDLQILE